MTINQSPVSYPEHHAVWLDAMGISRWHSTAVEETIAPAQNMTSDVSKPATQVASPLPDSITKAMYWVIGATPLDHDTAYLLAGMMHAIQATDADVVYSHIAPSNSSTVATGLPHFPKCHIQTIAHTEFDIPEQLNVLILGDMPVSFSSESMWRLPSLPSLLDNPLLKRDAWNILKAMRAKNA